MEELLAAKNKNTNKKTSNTNKETSKKEVQAETKQEENKDESFIKNIDLAQVSWDVFLIGFFVIGTLIYRISLGKNRIMAILLSIYVALAVVMKLPEAFLQFNQNEGLVIQIIAFLVVFIGMFFLLSGSAMLRDISLTGRGAWWQTLIFSFLQMGLIISVAMSFMPEKTIDNFSAFTQNIFTNEWALFAWLIAPLFVLFIFRGRGDLSKEDD